MSKHNAKASTRKLQEAIAVRRSRSAERTKLVITLVIAIVLWGSYSFFVEDRDQITSIIVFAITLGFAFIAGLFGTRYSRLNNEYRQLKAEYSLTEDEIRQAMRNHR